MIPLLYRASVIVYNKSHVPFIMEYSRTDEKTLAATAHEILREISSRTPEVLKAHVQEICKSLQDEAPSAEKTNEAGAVDDLKACASFASKFPKDIPQDRNFVQAMTSYAIYGSPPEAAKQAVSIIMASSDKREMLAKELVHKCIKGFEYGGEGFLSRLATLSQLMLLAPNQVDEESDAVIDIAIKQILLQVRTPSTESPDAYKWSPEVDTECSAKCWALKILVNRLRSHPTETTLREVAEPVYNLLSSLISHDGELASAKDTPSTHKPRLRLVAARLYLKLCTKRSHEALLTPAAFNALALVAQDAEPRVRSGFLQRLRKYLGQQKLPQRFYTVPFLLAFEPNAQLKNETTTWIRSRANFFSTLKSQQSGSASSGKANTVMESVFARLLSLLAHHPDYDSDADSLLEFSRYIIFYLQNVATEDNLSLIYHIAQRIKQCRDAVIPASTTSITNNAVINFDDNLYHLSDLAQLTIRKFEDTHSWSIQTLPAKIRLPSSLFLEIKSHEEAQAVAERNHLPDGVEDAVESLVRHSLRKGRRGGKRRSEAENQNEEGRESKRAKGSSAIRKAVPKEKKSVTKTATRTPKRPAKSADDAAASSERRTSGRVRQVGKGIYAERDSEDDDEEMEVLEWEVDGKIMSSEAVYEATEDGEEEGEAGDEVEDEEEAPKPKLTPRAKKGTAPDAAKRKTASAHGEFEDPMDVDDHPQALTSPKPKTKSKLQTPKPTNPATKPKSSTPTNHTKSQARSTRHPDSSSIDELSPHKPTSNKTSTPLRSNKPNHTKPAPNTSHNRAGAAVEEEANDDEPKEPDQDSESEIPNPPSPSPKAKNKKARAPTSKTKSKSKATAKAARPVGKRPKASTRSGR